MGLKHRLALVACLLVALGWLVVYGLQVKDRLAVGGNDFLQLYAGAQLVGTPQLYEPEAVWRVHREAVGYRLPSVAYTRPPFYAWLLQPLGTLPYPAAYWLFMAVNFGGIGWFCWRFFRHSAATALLVACFPPLYAAILGGNDLGLVLGFLGAALLLMEDGRDVLAGLVLSLCAIKFHLFVLLPGVLWILGRRRVIAGGAAGGAVLMALSFAAQGWDWPRQYLALLRNPLIHPQAQAMPNLHGLMASLPTGSETWATLAASALVAGCVLWLASRERANWQAGIAYALLGGLLVSWHCYIQDSVLLLPVLAILQKSSVTAAVRAPLAITLLPITFWMLAADAPLSGLPAFLMCVTLAGAVWQSRTARSAGPATVLPAPGLQST